jgi:histidinol-phosphate aminotransferase
MSRFDSKAISEIAPYVAGEQPKDMKYIKLNTNENPYPPSPKVEKAIKNFDYSSMRLYPDPDASVLKAAISKAENVDAENVFCSNSSDEILAMVFMAFFGGGKEVAFPDVTYSFYPVWCDVFGAKAKIVPLKSDWSIDFEKFPTDCGGIVVCNPNAPTGIAVKKERIERVAAENRNTLIVCDEAYIDFGGESSVELTKNYDNIIVVKTLSKSRSLAGARVGYAIANADLIKTLEKTKNSFNSYTLDRFTIEIAAAAVEDEQYFENCRKKVIGTRNRAVEELRNIGFDALDSSANFIFVSPLKTKVSAKDLYSQLKSHGILVRYWDKPRISDWLRISVGTDAEMKALIDAVKEIIKAKRP